MEQFFNLNVIYLIIQTVLAVLYCFWGYRFMRVLISVYGFLIGSVLCFLICTVCGATLTLSIILALVAGLVIGGISFSLYSVGIFFVGAFWGLSLSSFILSFASVEDGSVLGIVIIILSALLLGLLALKLRRPFLIVSTSFSGGTSLATYGGFLILNFSHLSSLASQDLSYFVQSTLPGFTGANQAGIAAASLILGALGVIIQFLVTAKKKK